MPHVGRYAPSPTGDLHVGNAFAAALTWARAVRRGGVCLLRIEDLDTPRVVKGATQRMQEDLRALGLRFQGDVIVQSSRTRAYEEALQKLKEQELVYACSCSRKDLAASAPHVGDEGPVYPGTCRDKGTALDAKDTALRVRTDKLVQRFGNPVIDDAWQGRFTHDVEADVGDFIVRRKDGLFAYQLAVVVDDAFSGVTEVVRGVDLLASAPRQVLLHHALASPPPTFAHLPLLVDGDGHRLSKRSPNAPALLRTVLATSSPQRLLGHFLRLLGQAGEGDVDAGAFAELLDGSRLSASTIAWRSPI